MSQHRDVKEMWSTCGRYGNGVTYLHWKQLSPVSSYFNTAREFNVPHLFLVVVAVVVVVVVVVFPPLLSAALCRKAYLHLMIQGNIVSLFAPGAGKQHRRTACVCV